MEIRIRNHNDFVSIKLSGVIDEDNDLASQCLGIHDQLLKIDLGEVERINSCGVRDWVNWISSLEARGSQILFVECSPAIVAQINLVNNFTGSGSVKSFYLPYFCSQCHEERTVLCQACELGDASTLPPMQRCDGCDRFMDFDDMSDAYFSFLRNEARVVVPRALALPAPPKPIVEIELETQVALETEVATQVDPEIEARTAPIALAPPAPPTPQPQDADRRVMHYLPWGLLAIAVSALALILITGT